MKKTTITMTLLGAVLAAAMAFAADSALKPDHPERYVVKEGDTLWDISGRFLHSPWLWTNVWYANPQIKNPHLIYPGDVVSLVYVDGKPRLTVDRRSGKRPVVKLSPEGRSTALTRAVPTIPMGAIRPFLTEPHVVELGQLDNAPYIVEPAGEHIVVGAGADVYVMDVQDPDQKRYAVVRPAEPLVDPDTNELLAYHALFVGDAVLQRGGNPATMKLTRTTRESGTGDRLIPATDEEYDAYFMPKAPSSEVDGRIISVVDGVTQIGQHDVVILNRGAQDGLEPGHVLAIYQVGEVVDNTVTEDPRDTVKLPDERAGEVMVFRTFDRVSFALVMRATEAVHVLDRVTSP